MPDTNDSQPKPHADAILTTPANTFIETPHSTDEGILLYRPEDNSFLAVYSDEWAALRLAAWELTKPIRELQEANREATEKAVALRELQEKKGVSKKELKEAEAELAKALSEVAEKAEAAKKKIEPVKTLEDDAHRMIELVALTGKRLKEENIEGHAEAEAKEAERKGEKKNDKPDEKKKKKSKSEEDGISRKNFTPLYVPAHKLQNVLNDKRVYFVEGKAEREKREKDKIFSGGRINHQEIHKQIQEKVQDKAKFAKKWKLAPEGAEEYSGVLGDWAKTMGADTKKFLERTQEEVFTKILPASISHDKNDPYRMIDLKSDAQVLRWAGGAGLEANFSPFQGSLFDARDKDWRARLKRVKNAATFGIKANAEASFAVGEAKVETILYLPHYTGWEVNPEFNGQKHNFGYFRLQADLILYGLAGASVALEADMGMMLTAGNQGVRGTPKEETTEKAESGAKAKVGGKTDIALFAGLKEGISLAGAVQWLNPEGVLGVGKPKKLKPDQAVAAYADIAKVSATAEAIQGLAAKLGFECAFRDGAFHIAGDFGLCLGLGGGGKVAASVGAATIADFFMCVCHTLKQSDYQKMGNLLMNVATFGIFNKILFLAEVGEAGGKNLQTYAKSTIKIIQDDYDDVLSLVRRKGSDFLRKLEKRMKDTWGWYAYLPPEARGAMMLAISEAAKSVPDDRDAQLAAAYCTNELLSTTQTPRHLDKTLERLTYAMGETQDNNFGARTIERIVANTEFAGALEAAKLNLAKAQPLIGRPFLRNSDSNFVYAELPVHGTIYTV